MKELEIKMTDITEEMISDLINFLDNGIIPEGRTEAQLAFLYGRLRAKGEKIQEAELWLEKDEQKKKESYKRKILNQIKQGLEEMRNENIGAHYEYEIANIKNRECGRTVQLGFRDTDEYDRLKRRKSVLIQEWNNPEFFQEILKKYSPNLPNN